MLIYSEVAIEKLPDNEQSLLDTNRNYFSNSFNDSVRINRLLRFIFESKQDTISLKFNDAVKHFCEVKVKGELASKEHLFYLEKLANSYQNEAYYLGLGTNYERAIELDFKALNIYRELKDTSKIVSSLLNIGVTQFNIQIYKDAGDIWQEALILQRITKDSSKLVQTYNMLGGLSVRQERYEEAQEYFNNCLLLTQKEDNPYMEAYTYNSLGNLYVALEKYDQAFRSFKQSLEKFEAIGEEGSLSDILFSLYLVSEELGDDKKAKYYALRTYENAKKTGYASALRNGATALSEIYEKEGNYLKSLELYKEKSILHDSINREQNREALIEQEYLYKYQKKVTLDSLKNAAAIALQISENKRRKNTANYLWISLGFLILFAAILWNRFSITKKQKTIIENDKNELNQANEKLKSLDELKSRFFTNISHEIRTPLTVISGMADQIKNKPKKWTDRGVGLIKKNTNQLLNLVNQILELKKLESGNLSFNFVHDDIIQHIRYIVESFHSLVESKDIELHYQIEEKSIMMDYDPEKMIRIISNLLSNAIKFTPSGGNVFIHVSQISKKERPFLLLKVKDTGVGIPQSQMSDIFNRFYQVENSSTRSSEGTGIGLALVKELLHFLKGQIEVESELGKGTTFSIHLPVERKNKSEEKSSPSKSIQPLAIGALEPQPIWATKGFDPKSDRPTILVVEDNLDVISYIVGCLEDIYQVETAKNGEEGIEKALELIPDLIISDIMMPIKDGLEVCNTLKQDERTSHIPIILLTARADIESKLSGLSRGADAYLTKPFNQEELLIRIQKLLEVRMTLQEHYRLQAFNDNPKEEPIEIEDSFLQKIRAVINENIDDENFKVPDLCHALGFSRSQLHNKIKALTGESTTHIMRSIRFQKAITLLKSTDLQVAEIAYQVGFRDAGYFSKAFAEYYGKSPREVRKTES